MSHCQKIFVIAGEASGDRLGGKLINSLRQASDELTIEAIGGRFIEEQGIKSLFPMQELSLMGFLEVLPHIPRLRKRIKETVAYIENFQPDILITIDSPGFCYRVVNELRNRQRVKTTRFIHYVAPSVWAYKPERAAKTAKLFDILLTLFPFEPPYFEKEGLKTYFVGHWIYDEPAATADEIENFRHKLDKHHRNQSSKEKNINICAFAGSRSGEIRRMLPIFGDTLNLLENKYFPEYKVNFILPTIPDKRELVEKISSTWKNKPLIIDSEEDKKTALALADIALVKSGTITLEVAKSATPMITTYKANPISIWLVRKMIKIPYVNLVNILLNKFAIPEFIQEKCSPEELAKGLHKIFSDKEIRDAQIENMQKAIAMLHSNHDIARLILSSQTQNTTAAHNQKTS